MPTANDQLRQARERTASPTQPGECLSRQELAELVNAYLWRHPCVVHGDAWGGNVVTTADGQVVLLDLERCSVGPPEWDLASTAIKLTSFGWITAEVYRDSCDRYGQDVTAWSGFELFRDIRELRMALYVAQRAAEHSDASREASYRIDCLRGRAGVRPWRWTPAN